MHYSTWLALLGMVWSDSKYLRDLRAERLIFLKGFFYRKFSSGKLNPLRALCLSKRGVNAWGMNNAGQKPIVWWRTYAAQGAAKETLWNIDLPLRSCCLDVAHLLGCEWRYKSALSVVALATVGRKNSNRKKPRAEQSWGREGLLPWPIGGDIYTITSTSLLHFLITIILALYTNILKTVNIAS